MSAKRILKKKMKVNSKVVFNDDGKVGDFYLQGIWNKKCGFKQTLLFERTLEVIKIGLYICRVSHFSLEMFIFVWYVNNSTAYVTLQNDLLGNQVYLWDYSITSLEVDTNAHVYSFKWLYSTTSMIFLISQKVILTYAVEIFSYQTNPNISRLKWDTRQL